MRKLLPVLLVLSAALAAVEPDPVLPPVVYVAHETGTDIDPDDRTVFPPYARFLALLAATRSGADSPTESAAPPVPAVLESWTARIQVAGDAADVRIEGTSENLSEGWASLSWPGSLGFSRFSSPVEGVSLERRGERLLLHLRNGAPCPSVPRAWRLSAPMTRGDVNSPSSCHRPVLGRWTSVCPIPMPRWP